ncbi:MULTISPECIES: hypothetical protein [unclassified Novosphingobium]|uniref:hypothetical protein n=1 Tax=unclassified Novosphingobium TaxID=2644732 RepID=UPI0012C4BF17|nr:MULTISPECIES: hypothetical protein [unclassified Novosphingobium]MPS68490.1 hypothetical protein [Novosphingobium sp.]
MTDDHSRSVYRAGMRHKWLVAALFAIVWGMPLALAEFGAPPLAAMLVALALLFVWARFARLT